MSQWQSPNSDNAKGALITRAYGRRIPKYVWYDLGELTALQPGDWREVAYVLLAGNTNRKLDVEMIYSNHLKTEDGKRAVLMRVCNPSQLVFWIRLSGKNRPLYQVGHDNWLFPETGEPVINFAIELP